MDLPPRQTAQPVRKPTPACGAGTTLAEIQDCSRQRARTADDAASQWPARTNSRRIAFHTTFIISEKPAIGLLAGVAGLSEAARVPLTESPLAANCAFRLLAN